MTVKFGTITLPLKLAVLPPNSKLTVKLLVVTLLDTLIKLAVAKLPKFALLTVKLPFAVTAFEVLSKVNPVLPSTKPALENNTVVLAAVIVMLACTLPTNVPAVT